MSWGSGPRGGLPERRPDQHDAATPRTVAPGARLQQIANNKGKTITVQVINEPGTPIVVQIANEPGMPVVVQDGGVLNAKSHQAYATDGNTQQLVGAAANVNGLQLWTLSISSYVASAAGPGVVTTDDQVQDSAGTIYGSVVNGIAAAVEANTATVDLDLRGLEVPAGLSLSLVNGTTTTTHRTSATLVYTVL